MNSKTRYSLSLLAALSALLNSTTDLRATETDDRIESAAAKSYVYKTYLKDDAITTTSKNGVVTLTGTVLHAYHKSLAEDTVENLPGVIKVDNQLTLNANSPSEQSDGWLSTKVKTTLLFHRNVSASATDVYVKDGVVSLRGEASSAGQKDLTGEYAKDIEGVKEVKNEMTIAKTPVKPSETASESIDDASITAQVKSTLTLRRSISSLKIRVATREGVVTLTGIARNEAEKGLVGKLVDDIYGVSKVINNITIEVAAASAK